MAVRGGGKMARTRWHVDGRYQGPDRHPYTLVDVRLLTGRTHQIRVHFSWMGYPLVGDDTYGSGTGVDLAPRQFLHARELGLTHPRTEERMHFEAPLPEDLVAVLEKLTIDD
jgi:23S rRNA pseudouridine1911/1915/1917 synthase